MTAFFIVKVSDFGILQRVSDANRLAAVDLEVTKNRLLWTAPELLRMEQPPIKGKKYLIFVNFN